MEQVQDRQVSARFTMRERNCLQHHPSRLVPCLEFVEQARFADSRFGHHGDNLAAPLPRVIDCLVERVHFALPSDELGQSAPGRALQSRTQQADGHNLVNVDQFARTLDTRQAERF
jgi:hypothetical protein